MIKTIVFDFDQTIYTGYAGDPKLYDRIIFEQCFQEEGLYEWLNRQYGLEKMDVKDIVEVCRKEGLDYKKFATLYNKNIYLHTTGEKVKVLPNKFFMKLKRRFSLYVASMSNVYYLRYHFQNYGLDINNFKDVLAMDLIDDDSKAVLLEKIRERENCKPEEMLMIGDNLNHDIKPALALGMNALHFQGDFNQIYDFMTENKLLNCDEFRELAKD